MATIQPTDFKLQDGRELRVRSAKLKDAGPLLSSVRRILATSAHLRSAADELRISIEDERALLTKMSANPNQLMLIALVDDEVIGNLMILNHERRRVMHRGSLSLGLLQSFRSLGIGRCLMNIAIEWATYLAPDLRRLELVVHQPNVEAIGLYRSLGFVEEGRIKHAVRYDDGTYEDEILMALTL